MFNSCSMKRCLVVSGFSVLAFMLGYFISSQDGHNVFMYRHFSPKASPSRHYLLDGRPTDSEDIKTDYTEPLIILWYVKPRYVNNTPGLDPLRLCPERNCFMTTNVTYMAKSAAVLFNAQIMKNPKPPKRPFSDQVWILHNTEPQKSDWNHGSSFRFPPWYSQFNWTMFYRSDSDIFAPYGIVRKKQPSELVSRDLGAVFDKKKKMVAGMISHCGTEGKRAEYIKMLEKHVDLDLYGGCGTLKWPRSKDNEFIKMANDTYKFYLAFENSFCDDYISEKFYRYYATDMIMIARGGAKYSNFVPKGTFIDTRDFKTVESLGKHIKYLSENKEAYLKILRSKDKFISETEAMRTVIMNTVVFTHYQYESVPFCEICYRLRNLDYFRKTISRVDKWFDKKNCYAPNDLI